MKIHILGVCGTFMGGVAILAREAGFDNVNMDLMFALPGQTLAQAVEDVHTAISFAPPHVSHYQLTIEPNTYFHAHRPEVPDDESAWPMQARCPLPNGLNA